MIYCLVQKVEPGGVRQERKVGIPAKQEKGKKLKCYNIKGFEKKNIGEH